MRTTTTNIYHTSGLSGRVSLNLPLGADFGSFCFSRGFSSSFRWQHVPLSAAVFGWISMSVSTEIETTCWLYCSCQTYFSAKLIDRLGIPWVTWREEERHAGVPASWVSFMGVSHIAYFEALHNDRLCDYGSLMHVVWRNGGLRSV